MKENYSMLPESVEIYEMEDGKVDVILRKNIEETTLDIMSPDESPGEPQTIYQCDELQFRYSGSQTITKELIEEDFDSWWEYAAKWTPNMEKELQPTLEERVSACEESVMALIDIMFDISDDDEEPEDEEDL